MEVMKAKEELCSPMLNNKCKLMHKVWDIEGFYPSMPRENIVRAMIEIMNKVKKSEKLRGANPKVTVPITRNKRPRFGIDYQQEGRKIVM